MSVPFSKRSQGKLAVQTKAYEFASYTDVICSNEKVFLKRNRWCCTESVVASVHNIAKCIDLANKVNVNRAIHKGDELKVQLAERLRYQKLALRYTIEAETEMEIAYRDNNSNSEHHFNEEKFNNWGKLLLEVRNLIALWIKSDKKQG